MIRLGILGTGNVAKRLFEAFMVTGSVEVVQVVGRNEAALQSFGNGVPTSSDFSIIKDADVFIIAVQDEAIASVSKFLRNKKGLVVHTSGSVSMDILSPQERYGVFYPLQTFSRDREVDMRSVPFCLEAQHKKDMTLLKKLAATLSETMYEVDSEQRKAIHLAAVFVNNFTNHLFYVGQQICEEKGLPFPIFHPLIRETVDKIEHLAPYDAQTGPARRGDFETISLHMQRLKKSGMREIYKVMSESIEKLYYNPTPK